MSSHAMVVERSSRDETKPKVKAKKPARTAGRTSTDPRTRPGGALGGEPRVSLLPAEVNDFHRAKAVRQRLVAGAFLVLLLVGAGVAGAYYLSMTAQAQLAASQAVALDLVTQEADFADLKAAKSGIALIEAGQYVGASTEIDWKTYLEDLQATLPTGVAVTSVTIDSASPFVDYAQSSTPLEGSRIATLIFTATSPTLPEIPTWLNGLGKLVGFADAVPGSVNAQDDGTYIVNITMHINSEAFDTRFPGEAQ